MVYGVSLGPSVDESDLTAFSEALSSLPAEEWQRRIAALKNLVDSIPDYSTSPVDEDGGFRSCKPPPSNINANGGNQPTIPWYRSSKSVRRLAHPLRTLLLDARSAVVKEATELIGTLFMVKLQPQPSITTNKGEEDCEGNDVDCEVKGKRGLETIEGELGAPGKKGQSLTPPPAFVGRLLLKDLLPSILDLSRQTVKVIRAYGVNMTIDILPHCRVKSCIVTLLERMKTHQNRTVREDCARYLRCVLETYPTDSCDNISDKQVAIMNSRKEERLTLDSTRQIGLGLGRTLSDSAKPVREEAKRGFQVMFRRFRPVWDEVMSSGVVRDVRLRKKLLDAASRSDGNGANISGNGASLFDDMASLGEMSLNSAVSGMSYASHRSNMSHRSYASRGMAGNGVPSMIGTPRTNTMTGRSRRKTTPSSSSPGYMRATGSSAARNASDEHLNQLRAKESVKSFSVNQYVTSSGHVVSTPSPQGARVRQTQSGGERTQQPFASLLCTPTAPRIHRTPDSGPMSCNVLRKRLSRRISGIKDEVPGRCPLSPGAHLSSINETETSICRAAPSPSVIDDPPFSEITKVALEVLAAHLCHLEEVESMIGKEKNLLIDMNGRLGMSVTEGTNSADLAERLGSLSEEQVCDYFESLHTFVDRQREAGESLLREMERISEGGDMSTVSAIDSPENLPVYQGHRADLAQSPAGDPDLMLTQRDLKDEFIAPA